MTPVTIVGGGMITHDQLLPAILQLRRLGQVGDVTVCSSRASTVEALKRLPIWQEAFPDQQFAVTTGYPEAIGRLPAHSIVIVAVPDHLHFEVIDCALAHDQHVCAVKPLVLKHSDSVEIAKQAFARGLVVGVEFHKRFDDRSLMARRKYRAGAFGEFRLGSACLLEKWNYRHSNFQNWFSVENSDAFTYIGCHYVDLVHFITGLLPVAVSVYGVRDRFPNGNEGYLWTDARVIWSNGACLNVQNALGFPDHAPGSNTQGLTLYCSGADDGGWLAHSDQYRGLQYAYSDHTYAEPSPDYFQYVDLGGPGLVPVGYGYRSVEHIVSNCLRIEAECSDLTARQKFLTSLDAIGLMATPANSSYNERLIEAARASLLENSRTIEIKYS